MACLETHASLRVFSQTIHPDEISRVLGFSASKAIPLNPDSRYRARREYHFWKWSSDTELQSGIDNIEHIRTVVRRLAGKERQLDQLRDMGCEVDIGCYWVSDGQGGPYLDTATLTELARLKLEIWWDVYFSEVAGHARAADAQTSSVPR